MLDSVFSESLRLCQGTFLLRKVRLKPSVLTDTHGKVSACLDQNDTIVMSMPSVLRDETVFPQAHRFIFDRFVEERLPRTSVEANRIRKAYLPFGSAKSMCPVGFPQGLLCTVHLLAFVACITQHS